MDCRMDCSMDCRSTLAIVLAIVLAVYSPCTRRGSSHNAPPADTAGMNAAQESPCDSLLVEQDAGDDSRDHDDSMRGTTQCSGSWGLLWPQAGASALRTLRSAPLMLYYGTDQARACARGPLELDAKACSPSVTWVDIAYRISRVGGGTSVTRR